MTLSIELVKFTKLSIFGLPAVTTESFGLFGLTNP